MAADSPTATLLSHGSPDMQDPPMYQKNYDLGILFIHGIGTQKKGDTLLAFGEPIATWLSRWLSEPNVEYGAASLTGDDPAHAELTLKLGQPKATHWLLAECCWADAIQAPHFSDLVVWAGQVAPATIVFHFFERAHCAWGKLRAKGSKIERLTGLLSFLSVLLSAFIVFLLLPLLMALLAACLVLALFPIPLLQKASQSIQKTLSSVLGDSYVLVRSRFQQAAILTRLRRDIEWIQSKQCQRICIVAHSQGASIADRFLLEHPNYLKTVPIFTLGSGVGKLAFVEALLNKRKATAPISAWAIVPCMLILSWGAYMCVGLLGEGIPLFFQGLWWERLLRLTGYIVLLLGFIGVISIPILYLLGLSLRPLGKVSRPTIPQRPQLDRDYYANADPVPSFVGGNGSMQIRNYNSILFDHTTYFENLDEFVGSLVVEIAQFNQTPLSSALNAVNDARTYRSRRVRWLSIARAFAVLVSLVIIFSDRLPVIRVPKLDPAQAAKILGVTSGLSDSSVEQLVRAHPVVITATATATSLAIIWGLYGLIVQTWKWWEAADLDAYFARTPYQPLTIGSIYFWFLLTACVELAMLYQFKVLTTWGVMMAFLGSILLIFPIHKLVRTEVHQKDQLAASIGFVCLTFLFLLPTECILYRLSSFPEQYLLFTFLALPVAWLILATCFLSFRAKLFP